MWRDKGKYYHFHKDYGYNTDECRTLKDDIEALTWHGHLSRYVAKKTDQAKPAEEKAIEQP